VSQQTWEPYFVSNTTDYSTLLAEFMALSDRHPGWTLTEIKELSVRERRNWIEIAKEGY